MKKLYLSFALVLFFLYTRAQQNNPAFGLNAHLTDSVGEVHEGGILDNYWQTTGPLATQNFVGESLVRWMRYGGKQVENDCIIEGSVLNVNDPISITIRDYVKKVKIFRANGIEPILTLPLKLDPINIPNFQVAAHQSALLVREVNTQLGLNPVLRWIYSNEPNGGPHYYDTTIYAAQNIHDYIKNYHDSVMFHWNAVWGTPIFIGPELAGFDNYDHGSGKVKRLTEQLLGRWNQVLNTNTPEFDIRSFVSTWSYHYYPFGDESDTSNAGDVFPFPNRNNAVKIISQSILAKAGFSTQTIQQNIDSLHAWGWSALKPIAITEANICYINDINNLQNNDGISGVGANSFIAGQVWSELQFTAMLNKTGINFWSGAEGSASFGSYKTNCGYLNTDPNKFGNTVGAKKPTWFHFEWVSEGFPGTIYKGQYNQNGVTPPPTYPGIGIKTWASIEPAGFKIMMQNQNDSAYNFRVNFDGIVTNTSGKITITYPLTSDSNGGMIDTVYYPRPSDLTPAPIQGHSTIVLTFNCNGKFQMRKDYTELMAQNNQPPQLKQIQNTDVNPQMIACNQPGVGGTISSNTSYSNTTVYVTSDLLLASNTNLTFDNCKVIVSPNVQIKATPMASIDIKNGTVMLGCDGKQWKGIYMIGNYQNGERLHIENSFIFNAKQPVIAEKIPDLKILGNVFANGEEAITLNRSQSFTINNNLIGGFDKGILTSNTMPNYPSIISENRFLEISTGIQFNGDGHNMLDIVCNEFIFKNKAIDSRQTTLKVQGDALMGAGNTFLKTTGSPSDYIDHTGPPTKYYFGPAQTNEFGFPNVMNIPKVQSIGDRLCTQKFQSVCPNWINGVEENTFSHSQFNIYPNPSSGAFTVKYSDLPKGNWTLNVHDVLGRLITSKKIDSNSDNTTLQINAKGFYFVTLQSEAKRITQKVLVE